MSKIENQYPELIQEYGLAVVGEVVLEVAHIYVGEEKLQSEDVKYMVNETRDRLNDMLVEGSMQPSRQTRWHAELARRYLEKNQKKLPDEVLQRIARNPEQRADIIAAWERNQSMTEAKKRSKDPEDRAYAIGMAAAKKEAGLGKKPAKDVPKAVIKKAHKIAKKVMKDKK